MKNISLLIPVFILLSLPGVAQSTFNESWSVFEFAIPKHGVFEKSGSLYCVTDNSAMRYGLNGQTRPFALSTPRQGNLLFSGPANGNKIVLFSYGMANCAGGKLANFIIVADTAGSSTTYSFTMPKGNVTAWTQLSNNTFVSFGDSVMITHAPDGSITATYSLPYSMITSATTLTNGLILISADTGGYPRLTEITGTGSIVAEYVQPTLYTKFVRYAGGQRFLCQGADGQLYKISETYGLNGSAPVAQGMLMDIDARLDTVYALVSYSNAVNVYAVCDTSFNTLATSTPTTEQITHGAICATSSGDAAILYSAVSTSGVPGIWNTDRSLAGVVLFPHLQGYQFNKNLELRNIQLKNISATNINLPILRFNADVTVRNDGNLPVSSFYLNCYTAPANDCEPLDYFEKFDVAIAPGDSVTVTTAQIDRAVYGVSAVGDTVIATVCIYVSLPDSSTDSRLQGNQLCNEFSGMTSLVSNHLRKINVFPNPVADRLTISCETVPVLIELTDLSGRIVTRIDHPMARQELITTRFENGIYFLRIHTLNGTAVYRIIRE